VLATNALVFMMDGGNFRETGRLSEIERHGALEMDRVDFVLREDKTS
jgi:hypothetical protein